MDLRRLLNNWECARHRMNLSAPSSYSYQKGTRPSDERSSCNMLTVYMYKIITAYKRRNDPVGVLRKRSFKISWEYAAFFFHVVKLLNVSHEFMTRKSTNQTYPTGFIPFTFRLWKFLGFHSVSNVSCLRFQAFMFYQRENMSRREKHLIIHRLNQVPGLLAAPLSAVGVSATLSERPLSTK